MIEKTNTEFWTNCVQSNRNKLCTTIGRFILIYMIHILTSRDSCVSRYMINLIISISQKYITTVSILILYSKALFSYGDVFEKQLFLFCKFSIKVTRNLSFNHRCRKFNLKQQRALAGWFIGDVGIITVKAI